MHSHAPTEGCHQNHRKCLATGEILPQVELIRFARAPDGTVVPDLKCSLPGRGVWVRARKQAITDAQKRKLFDRGFKAECHIEGEIAQAVERLLEDRALRYLSLANKAGLVVQGFEKTVAALLSGKLAVLVGASDGANDGRNKLKQKLAGGQVEIKVTEMFDSAQLSLALGRTNVIHAGVAKGGLARKFEISAELLASYQVNTLLERH